MHFTKSIQVITTAHNELINVTNEIEKVIRESNINVGLVSLFVPHTTAAITINENADPHVKSDMINGLNDISPDKPFFTHYEGNSDAHIKSSLVGVSETIILENSNMILGTWQGVYFCEFDGPRTRRLIINIQGE